MNNEQCDDSNFEKEGDYIMKKMPKYKYDIKIMNDSLHTKKRIKEPDTIVSSASFTIPNEPKNTLKKINIQKNFKNHNNEVFNPLHISKSPRMGTIRFYPQEMSLHNDNDNDNDNLLNTSYKKSYNNKEVYYQNYDNYRNNNNQNNKIYDDYRNNEYNDDIDFYYDNNNNYNKMDYYNENQIVHKIYNNSNIRNNNYNYNSNIFRKNIDYDNNCENENNSYIIEIFPNKQCICQKEIEKIIDDYYFSERGRHNNLCSNCHCKCGLNFCGPNDMTNINDNIALRNNKYNFYNYCSPTRTMRNRYPNQKEREMKKMQYPKYKNRNLNYINRSPNYRIPDYYFIKDNKVSENKNNITYNKNNDSAFDKNNNNNNFFDNSRISNKYNLKNEKVILTKKIKIPPKYYKSPKKEIGNNSFISVDNIRDKNSMIKISPYMKRKKLNKINTNNITKYDSKARNLSNNLNNTYISTGRRSNNIMISKSSEKKEKIKVFPLGKKIYPLIVKKSVERPKKEKIINKDGTTTNVIKQTSVITSVESKPVQTKNNNLKNKTYVKENITKIYTTLTKDDIDDNNNNINNNHFISQSKENLNDDNLNFNNYKNYKVNDLNIDMNFEDIKDDNNDIDNDSLNDNSPIINSSISSDIYKKSDFNNPSKMDNHIKYLKYLYYRCSNLNSIDGNNIGYIITNQKNLNIIVKSSPLIKKQKLSYDLNSEKINNRNKRSLFLKKINLKENKNKYYIEGVYKLFNDENVFLENLYKGKKIIIGKSRNKSSINNHSIRVKNKHYTKKAMMKSMNASNNTKSNFAPNNNNTFVNESINQINKGRKAILIGKRNDNYITDDELKQIYQECIIRENENNLQLSTIKSKYSKNKSFINGDNKNISSEHEVNNILNLQSLVLSNYKLRNVEENKMIDRLLRHTSKNKEKLLMNQINDYRLRKEKIDEMDKNNLMSSNPKYTNFKEINKKLQWCTSLRDYQNKIEVNDEKNKRLSSSNIHGFSSPNKNFYSFDKRDIVFDLSGQIKPLFAQITPKTIKENEKIRDTLIDLKIQKKMAKNNKINNPIKDKNVINRQKSFLNKKGIKGNLYKGLNIRGKKLINFEIELSKDLEGKKKKIVQFPYKEEEITNKIFAKSYSVNNFYIPKSLKNTVELHYDKKY